MRKVNILGKTYQELTGVIHNHTIFSYDCDVPISTIINAAYKNRLDYITINDHGIIPERSKVEEGVEQFNKKLNSDKRYEPVVITGAEMNDDEDCHHLLVFSKEQPEKSLQIPDSFHDLAENSDNFLFAAHPYENRICNDFPLYIWKKPEFLEKVQGMEIWNFASSWLSKLHPRKNGIFLLLFPNCFVRKPFRQNLQLWDKITSKGIRFAAIGSTDAHGTPYKLLFFKIRILTHKYLFGTIRTNILLAENEEINEKSVLEALRQGRSYIVNYRLGYPYNFSAGVFADKGKGVTLGDEIPFAPNLKFYYNLPKPAKVSLMHEGKRVDVQNSKYGDFSLQKTGAYRLEIEKYCFGWIYTNNIYVTAK